MATRSGYRRQRGDRGTVEADDIIGEESPVQIHNDEEEEDEQEEDEEDEPRGPGDMCRKVNGRIPGNPQV